MKRLRHCVTLLLFSSVVLVTACGPADNEANQPIKRDSREVTFVTTPQVAVDRMLEICQPTDQDYVLDLGCGDGRIVITAAKKFGCKGLGFDIDPKLIQLCRENAKREGVEHLVEFKQQDIYEADLPKDATIVTLYLYPQMNLRLLPYLQSLPKGQQVVSFRWRMPGVKAHQKEKINTGDKLMPIVEIRHFTTPLLVDPDWKPTPSTPEETDFNKIKDKLLFAEKSNSKSEKGPK